MTVRVATGDGGVTGWGRHGAACVGGALGSFGGGLDGGWEGDVFGVEGAAYYYCFYVGGG